MLFSLNVETLEEQTTDVENQENINTSFVFVFFKGNHSNTEALKQIWRFVSSPDSIPLRFTSHTLSISGRNNPHVRNPIIRCSVTDASRLLRHGEHPLVSLLKWSVRNNAVNKQTPTQPVTPAVEQSGAHVSIWFSDNKGGEFLARELYTGFAILASDYMKRKTYKFCLFILDFPVGTLAHEEFADDREGFLWTSSLSVSEGWRTETTYIQVKRSKCFNFLPFWCWRRWKLCGWVLKVA